MDLPASTQLQTEVPISIPPVKGVKRTHFQLQTNSEGQQALPPAPDNPIVEGAGEDEVESVPGEYTAPPSTVWGESIQGTAPDSPRSSTDWFMGSIDTRKSRLV